ncbi:MAG: NAD(P)-dependent oxidoreductase, partial [Thermoplasmata archaeon]|nr:NAD(P)-dependent oxidoreductase [Thermoplasmata archaeon]
MAILLTGGFGHIGSWVCHEIARQGRNVIVIDRSRRRLRYLEGLEGSIEFEPADVLDHASVYRIFKEHEGRIEGIIHVAGLMGGPFFATKPQYHIQINTMGTVGMLEAARIFGVDRFVYISSGAVYGPGDDIPSESDPMAPGDLYGAAKASAEFFGLQYANEFGIDFRAVRVYFAYGPGRLPSELYPLYNAVFGCLEGRTRVELPAGSDQAIDFTYVKDIARAILMVYDAPTLKYRQYNATSGVFHKLPELIENVSRIAGKPVALDIGPGRIMPRGPSLDSSRLREELGFA